MEQKRREKYSEKRKIQRRRQRMMDAGIGLLCTVIMGIVISIIIVSVNVHQSRGLQVKAENTSKQADTMSTAKDKTGQGTAEQVDMNTESQEKNNEVTPDNQAAPAAAVLDRSGFAATPGTPVGTTQQTAEKVVYLTLDDGPSQNTQAVLDILDKYQIKATFFVTGAMPEYRGLIKTAYDKGHTIGLHTFSHDYAKVYASVDAYFSDLDAIGQVVQEQIGYVPCFIRFPGGSSNSVSAQYASGIMTALSQAVQERGYQYYDWNGSFGDGAVRTADQLVAQGTSYKENNIVMLSHDSSSKQTTVEALPRIIEHYLGQGYVFKALDRESYVPHHGIGN